MELGRQNKKKGCMAEKYYTKVFKDLGFTSCVTSRKLHKKHDNAKIDLVNIPFNLQVKAGIQKRMNAGKELFMMKSCIDTMFPQGDEVFDKPLLLVHYQEVNEGVERLPKHERIYMSLKQFNLFLIKNPDLVYDSLKEFKFDLDSEFKIIVSMSFEVFKNQIIIKHYTQWD